MCHVHYDMVSGVICYSQIQRIQTPTQLGLRSDQLTWATLICSGAARLHGLWYTVSSTCLVVNRGLRDNVSPYPKYSLPYRATQISTRDRILPGQIHTHPFCPPRPNLFLPPPPFWPPLPRNAPSLPPPTLPNPLLWSAQNSPPPAARDSNPSLAGWCSPFQWCSMFLSHSLALYSAFTMTRSCLTTAVLTEVQNRIAQLLSLRPCGA